MSWADCGLDSEDRPIGYAFEAICDHLHCDTKIDRGLAFACGGMHGEDEYSCEKYFCSEHLTHIDVNAYDERWRQLCDECVKTQENKF